MKLLALAAVLAAAGLATGCGGGNGDNATPASTNFTECMKQQGIEIPNVRASGQPRERASGRPSTFPTARPSNFPTARPSGGFSGFGGFQRPAGVDEEKWQKALEACGSLRPSRAPGNQQGGGAMTAYLNCLREHGVTYSPGQTLPDAAKVCEILRPSATAAP
jgi:hypothetical protein